MSPLLLIDAGNTRIKWTRASPHVPLTKLRDYDELLTKEAGFAKIQALAKTHPLGQVVLACVVPKLLPHFKRAFGRRLFIVTGDSAQLGLKFDYPKPAELGADRLAAAVAVQALGQWPAIIVQCGTATVITGLNSRGALCGGVIAPGLQAQLDALLSATAQLPALDLQSSKESPLARNTRDAIRNGVLLSFQGGLREMVEKLGEAVSPRQPPYVFITGGNAAQVGSSVAGRREPLLVFEGLRIMGARVFYPLAA